MGARIEALRVSQPLDDERFRSHRAWDDAVAAAFGVDRTLSGNENLIAEMLFDRDVVVMTVDGKRSADTLVRISSSSGEISFVTICGRRSFAHAERSVRGPAEHTVKRLK